MIGAALLALLPPVVASVSSPDAAARGERELPAATPLSVLARAERTEARLGEPFAYEIDVRHRPDESYALAGDLEAAPFRGTARGCTRAESKGEIRTTCALSLALFALGPHDVPEVRLTARTPAGEAVLRVPGPRITGVGIIDPSVPPDRLSLREPAPPVPLLVPSLRLLWWAAGLAALAAAALLVRRALRARARAASEPPPPEPPGARLQRRLDALEAKGLPARGLGREHVFELSEIVREWIGAVAGVNALDLTTAELVERLRRAADTRLDVEALRRFCEEADLVKYARAPAEPVDCAAATAFARRLGS
jgi:hypothetical protein